jgi:hypothetical protein
MWRSRSGIVASSSRVAGSHDRIVCLGQVLSSIALTVGVQRVALLAEHEVTVRVRHVVAQHRGECLDEGETAFRVELVLDPAVG